MKIEALILANLGFNFNGDQIFKREADMDAVEKMSLIVIPILILTLPLVVGISTCGDQLKISAQEKIITEICTAECGRHFYFEDSKCHCLYTEPTSCQMP